MEMKLTVTFDVTPALAKTVHEIFGPCAPAPEPAHVATPAEALAKAQPSAPVTPEPAEPEPEPAAPEPETAKEPAPEYKEKPEDVLPLLRERFGIPANKEDRTDEDTARAKALNKAVVAVIREVAKDSRAKSISDLRTDADRQEFIRLALLLSYNVNSGQFEVNAF